MKTLLIVTKQTINKHAGEEYDDYMLVEPMVEPDGLPAAANLIRNKVRELIVGAQKEGDTQENHVKVEVDATPPYDVMIVSVADLMQQEEKIRVELPERLTRGQNKERIEIE